MNLGRPDRSGRLDALAAQYALGTLSPRARRRLATLGRQDATVAKALHDWELRLSTLADAVPGIAPPSTAWIGIRSRLGQGDAAAARAPDAGSAPWWASLSLWRGLAFAGFALAFALGITMLAPRSERPDERIVVVLAGQDARPALLATADRGGRFLAVKALEPISMAPDRTLELWALPEGKAPRSLGLIPSSGIARIPLGAPAGITFQSIPALAVSLEPAGGSPTGAPTGPVLYSGGVQKFY